MKTQDLISIKNLCSYYKIPQSFLDTLYDYQLIEIQTLDNGIYIQKTQIRDVEKIIRLHYDLEINIEGIDVIFNLLNQIEILQLENIQLKNQLKTHKELSGK
ncbi:chaperone modulator CbpM [Lacinutrix mariniflava]|uniref:chaperone modulator CbpM n=1 Tax=Lacinutrix mariniflava TaxID=342955 RepID=UPI0006E284D3|nr:chaperone modulator CbpM [Lacinutrix mariniflava]